MATPTVLAAGHADISVDLDSGRFYLYADPHGGGEVNQEVYDPASTVIEVPNKALKEVPAGQRLPVPRPSGQRIHQLPQAVLGRHVHGEIDPHLWQDVGNAQVVRGAHPGHADRRGPGRGERPTAQRRRLPAELSALDAYVAQTIASIPPSQRYLVTTHDAFAYLAHAYGIPVAGFVTPNPAVEPSLADRRKLTETIRNLRVRAVFLEPNLAARSSTLTEVAKEQQRAGLPHLRRRVRRHRDDLCADDALQRRLAQAMPDLTGRPSTMRPVRLPCAAAPWPHSHSRASRGRPATTSTRRVDADQAVPPPGVRSWAPVTSTSARATATVTGPCWCTTTPSSHPCGVRRATR